MNYLVIWLKMKVLIHKFGDLRFQISKKIAGDGYVIGPWTLSSKNISYPKPYLGHRGFHLASTAIEIKILVRRELKDHLVFENP